MSVRLCPFCKSPWVCWNWIISKAGTTIPSYDKDHFGHECWKCGSGFSTTYRIEYGMPYFFLKNFYSIFHILHYKREYKRTIPFLKEAQGILNSGPFDFSNFNTLANKLVSNKISESLFPKYKSVKEKLLNNEYYGSVSALNFFCRVMKHCNYSNHLGDFESRLEVAFPNEDNFRPFL